MPRAGLGVLYGASGSGKSFVALDLAASITRDENWRGQKTQWGRVGVIAAEGGGGYASRLKAYGQHHEVDLSSMPLFVMNAAPNFLLRDDGDIAQWLYPGLQVALYRDEAEGYYLNLSTGQPVWFVMWRVDETDPPVPRPELVTVSYNEAGRLLDAQERVDNVPLPRDVVGWLQAYTDEHYKPEPKKRRRPQSFIAPEHRG